LAVPPGTTRLPPPALKRNRSPFFYIRSDKKSQNYITGKKRVTKESEEAMSKNFGKLFLNEKFVAVQLGVSEI
jgi:hypothetical protein